MIQSFSSFFSQICENPIATNWEAILLKIILSFIAGAILGFERKSRLQTLGMRTLILICVSSTLLMILSINIGNISNSDKGRIAAQVVSGIGFLGGGAILRQGLNIKGLTSAAIIWTTAAIGLSIGAGLFFAAFLVIILGVIALIFLEKFENKVFPREHAKRLSIHFKEQNLSIPEIEQEIARHNIIASGLEISKNIEKTEIYLIFDVKVNDNPDILALSDSLQKKGNLLSISLSE